jgi:hypothetical protein
MPKIQTKKSKPRPKSKSKSKQRNEEDIDRTEANKKRVPELKSKLKQLGISIMDTEGNFLKKEKLVEALVANKREKKIASKSKSDTRSMNTLSTLPLNKTIKKGKPIDLSGLRYHRNTKKYEPWEIFHQHWKFPRNIIEWKNAVRYRDVAEREELIPNTLQPQLVRMFYDALHKPTTLQTAIYPTRLGPISERSEPLYDPNFPSYEGTALFGGPGYKPFSKQARGLKSKKARKQKSKKAKRQ